VGFRDQQNEVGILHRRDYGTRSAGWGVDDHVSGGLRAVSDLPDQRRSHGFSDAEFTVDQLDSVSMPHLQYAQLAPVFQDGSRGAHDMAASAAVAQTGEGKGGVFQDHQGSKPTNLGAHTAKGALGFVDSGNKSGDNFRKRPFRIQKKMAIGFFNIAIEELNVSVQ
jgi:hypothetical protein